MTSRRASVVIPAYNCEKTIGQTLAALREQMTDNVSVTVVDDGSRDGTRAIVEQFPSVIYLHQGNQGPAAARNAGAKIATGDILFFTDSDCVPHRDWVARALPHFDDPDVAAVMGTYGIRNPESWLADCIYHEILFRHQKLLPKYPKAFGSYNVAIRKSAFDAVGGFDVSYRHASGEDNDLSYKILRRGGRILFDKAMLVDHYHPVSVRKYLKEQFRHGFWRVRMYRDHPRMWTGDDYTFWKDIVEIPAVFLILVCVPMSVFFSGPLWILAGTAVLISLWLVQMYFSWIFTNNLTKTLKFSVILLMRAFSRMFGFLSGVVASLKS